MSTPSCERRVDPANRRSAAEHPCKVPLHKRWARTVLHACGYFAAMDRAWERRVSSDPAYLEPFDDGLPMPPPYLITLVGGTPSQRWFSEHGEQQARLISGLVLAEGVDLAAGLRVLDFGCGCGRIARRLAPVVQGGGGVFHGVDLQSTLVDWCSANLVGTYIHGGLRPPARLPAGSMDVIYAYSVLTHLTEPSAEGWLAEFARLLRPGGVALVTFQDEDFNTTDVREELLGRGYLTSTLKAEGRNHMSAWTTRARFASLAEGHLSVSRIIASDEEQARQAFAILRKPGRLSRQRTTLSPPPKDRRIDGAGWMYLPPRCDRRSRTSRRS